MTGTPSRTATALDAGVTPGVPTRPHATVMGRRRREGGWGRSCRQSPGPRNTKRMEATAGGQVRSIARSPMSSGPTGVDAAGRWGEGHASYPGRSVWPLMKPKREDTMRANRKYRPGRRGEYAPASGANLAYNAPRSRAREVERPTTARQKSAEATVAARTRRMGRT
jgi:hypothetical protein